MRLPGDQYVSLDLPLGARLDHVGGNRFLLTVPPLKFFDLEVGPFVFATVEQTDSAVRIESKEVVLKGSPFVESLNGCFDFVVRTQFAWQDDPSDKAITSTSKIEVWVNPPPPFKYLPRQLLESVGNAGMQFSLGQIERVFLQSLGKDYEKWALSSSYRQQRESMSNEKTDADVQVVSR